MLATIKKKLIQRMVFEGKDENPHLLRSRGPGLAAIGLDRPGSWAWTQKWHQKKDLLQKAQLPSIWIFFGGMDRCTLKRAHQQWSCQFNMDPLNWNALHLDWITSHCHTSRRTFPGDPRPPKSQSPHPHPACIMDSDWWYKYSFRVWAYTFEQKRRNGKRDGM